MNRRDQIRQAIISGGTTSLQFHEISPEWTRHMGEVYVYDGTRIVAWWDQGPSWDMVVLLDWSEDS